MLFIMISPTHSRKDVFFLSSYYPSLTYKYLIVPSFKQKTIQSNIFALNSCCIIFLTYSHYSCWTFFVSESITFFFLFIFLIATLLFLTHSFNLSSLILKFFALGIRWSYFSRFVPGLESIVSLVFIYSLSNFNNNPTFAAILMTSSSASANGSHNIFYGYTEYM